MEVAEIHDMAQNERLSARVIDRLHQMMCGLQGHDTLLQFEQDRMFLRCQSCGHETPGWDLNEAPPSITTPVAEPHHHAVTQPHLIGERRIA